MFDEPELHIIKFPDAEEHRAERETRRAASHASYVRQLIAALPDIDALPDDEGRAKAVLATLFDHHHIDDGEPCHCSCHPRLPESDFHDYGRACPCALTAPQRRAAWAEWEAERDAYWASAEGQAETRARQVDEDELISWLVAHPDVAVSQYGGMCPEQWRGSVAGHSFYFRERHGHWRIELDLRPSGRFSQVWVGGDLDDDSSFEAREIEEGEVVAEGATSIAGYGVTPVERGQFIVDTIRVHLARRLCAVHTRELERVEARIGHEISWCPACGSHVRRP